MVPTSATRAAQPFAHEVARLASRLRANLHVLTERLVEAILEVEPAYRDVAAISRQDLVETCSRNLGQLLDKLVDPTAGTHQYLNFLTGVVRLRIDQGLPLESLLHAYRIGSRIVWESFVEEARLAGDVDSQVLIEGSRLIWEFHEASSSRIAAAYREAEVRVLRRRTEYHDGLIDGLIEGRGHDVVYASKAAGALGIRPASRYSVVVCEIGDEGAELLANASRRLEGYGFASAWKTSASRNVGIVDIDQSSTRAMSEILRPLVSGRVGIGPAVQSLGDLSYSYQLAEVAMGTVPSGHVEVAVLEERLPTALLVAAPHIAELLVQHVLGPMCALPEDDRAMLFEVLEVYVDHGGSATATARALHCHRNTVLNRVRRIEAVTGRSLSDPSTLLLTGLAVKAAALRR